MRMPTWRNGGWLQEAWVNRASRRASDRSSDPRAALRKCLMLSHMPADVQRALDVARAAPPRAYRPPLAAYPDRSAPDNAAFVRAAKQLERGPSRRASASVVRAPIVEPAPPLAGGPAFSNAAIAALLVLVPPAGVFAVWSAEGIPREGKTAASVVAGLWLCLLAAIVLAVS